MTHSSENLDIASLSIEGNNKPPENALGSTNETSTSASTSRVPKLSRTNEIVRQYIRNNVAEFRDLDDRRIRGWNSPEADKHFKKLQENADTADDDTKLQFYTMNQRLGEELHDKTQAFYVRKRLGAAVTSLNLCMAPGGYTWYFLQRNPAATSFGITLPVEDGGHPMYLPHGEHDERVKVEFMDITMLASEFGIPIEDVPSQHPEASKFTADRPFLGEVFDVVICDGQVLRIHQHQRSPAREIVRLLVSQLILGLQRIKPGGTFIILLHKIDVWENMILLKTFETFSKIRVYKAEKVHAGRSSFYLVARNVQPDSASATEALKEWKTEWCKTTFGGQSCTGIDPEEPDDEEINDVLRGYGKRLCQLGLPIWSIQLEAMKRAHFLQDRKPTMKK
ncbi:hypothetical protein MMC07_006709 [Pseudocyphellaria aurata]|nr:hypothetical protein [Pseudocyphellaria aurata]